MPGIYVWDMYEHFNHSTEYTYTQVADMLNIYLACDRIFASGQQIVAYGQQQRKWLLTRIDKDNLQKYLQEKVFRTLKNKSKRRLFKYFRY